MIINPIVRFIYSIVNNGVCIPNIRIPYWMWADHSPILRLLTLAHMSWGVDGLLFAPRLGSPIVIFEHEYQILFESFTDDSQKLWTPEFCFFLFWIIQRDRDPTNANGQHLGYCMLLLSCRLPSKKIWRTPTPWDFDSGRVLASNDQKGDLGRIHWRMSSTESP